MKGTKKGFEPFVVKEPVEGTPEPDAHPAEYPADGGLADVSHAIVIAGVPGERQQGLRRKQDAGWMQFD